MNDISDVRISTKPSLHCSPGYRADDAGRIVKLFDVRTDRSISCGDQIMIETVDPARLPLPDAALLDLQWVLQRVVALRGGAEVVDVDYYGDNDDDDSDGIWLDSDEDENISDCSLSDPATMPSPGKIDEAIHRALPVDNAHLHDETH